MESAETFTKKSVQIAVSSIEGWTQDEVLGLVKGLELQGMTRAKREEMISQIYVALHEQSAKGESGPGHVAVTDPNFCISIELFVNIVNEFVALGQKICKKDKNHNIEFIFIL